MPKLHWDGIGEKLYEVGVDQGVLFTLNPTTRKYNYGKAWNGLSAVNENPSGAEPTKVYADNNVYANVMSAEEYGATIEAFTCPREFYACDGMASVANGVHVGQQARQKFAFSFRNKIGSDVTEELGYKYHLIYNAVANPSSRDHGTTNESPDISPLSWEITTDPIDAGEGMKKTAHIVIDSTEVDPDKLAAFLKILYGEDITVDPFDPAETYAEGDYVTHNSKTYEYLGAASFDPTKWEEVVATAFSTEATYEVGDYVTYDSALYVCTTAVTEAGAWDASNWNAITAAAFDAETSYAVGDYCTYESKTYKCTTAIVIEGGWNPSEWKEITNPEEIGAPKLLLPEEVIAFFAEG